MQVARMRRAQVERPNEFVLVVERGHHHIPHAALDDLLLNMRATWVGCQVLNESTVALLNRALVHGVAKVVDAILRPHRRQVSHTHVGPALSNQDLSIVQSGKPKEQIRTF